MSSSFVSLTIMSLSVVSKFNFAIELRVWWNWSSGSISISWVNFLQRATIIVTDHQEWNSGHYKSNQRQIKEKRKICSKIISCVREYHIRVFVASNLHRNCTAEVIVFARLSILKESWLISSVASWIVVNWLILRFFIKPNFYTKSPEDLIIMASVIIKNSVLSLHISFLTVFSGIITHHRVKCHITGFLNSFSDRWSYIINQCCGCFPYSKLNQAGLVLNIAAWIFIFILLLILLEWVPESLFFDLLLDIFRICGFMILRLWI